MIRFVPGFAAATVAFGLIELVEWMEIASATTELVLFLASYAIAALGFDHALRRYYGRSRRA